jgi:hypothetical protein
MTNSITEQDAENTSLLIGEFVRSYEESKNTIPLETWLITELQKHPNVWESDAEIKETAHEIITTIESSNEARFSLYAHTDAGNSESSWIANRIEQSAKVAGISDIGQYAAEIEAAIQQANEAMVTTIVTKDGTISQAFNLDGFLAEQHHVDTFNLEAAAQGKSFRAKALVPDGAAYGKNSMDIGIYDSNGKLVGRYQVKYGKDADATQILWKKGDYRGQKKLVPAEQVHDIEGATDRLEHDGIQSKPLTKAEAKKLQEKAQQRAEAKRYKWNDVNRGEIAKQIGKQALISVALVIGFNGIRILGRRIWNKLQGKQNKTVSQDLKEFFISSIKSGLFTGIQVAIAGAVVVAVKNGWLGKALKKTPAGYIAAAVQVGIENAKILYQFAKGQISVEEALNAMGKVTISTVVSLGAAGLGATQGAAIGAILGPIGAIIGGIIGGVVIGLLGSIAGDYIFEGAKTLAKAAKKWVKNIIQSASAVVSNTLCSITHSVSRIFS